MSPLADVSRKKDCTNFSSVAVKFRKTSYRFAFIRLDALAKALSVIATATWLGGWLGGWLSHSGTVLKRLNLSENFFDHLKATSL